MDRRPRGRSAVVAAVAIVALVGAVPLLGGSAVAPQRYVALGDSFTTGVGIVTVVGEPVGCFRSASGYPTLVERHLAPDDGTDLTLFDPSCNGATTTEMSRPQRIGDQANPPQLAVVTDRTALVTIGIGVNDIGFSSFMNICLAEVVAGGCRDRFRSDGTDALQAAIHRAAPAIGRLIDDVHALAPDAVVLVVGYPTILPADGDCPALQAPPADITYLHGVFDDLDAMLAARARAHGAGFVDTASSSVGHDACAGAAAWINGPDAGPDAEGNWDGIAFHPNAAGQQQVAALVTAAAQRHLDR